MKRYGYLYEQIIDIDNCRKAIINASESKKKKWYVQKILNNLDWYAEDLSNRLQNHNFTSPYRVKTIVDGCSKKERVIKIPKFYPDQCSHHAIIQIIKPLVLKSSYYWSCANIDERGTSRAQRGSRRITLSPKPMTYCAKMDIRKFYPSLKNEKLKSFLRTKIKDVKALEILDIIIDTSDGLPIGNYTSPWLAEWYLQRLDHYIKEELHIKKYVRYADDIVMADTNKKKLSSAMHKVINYISSELDLQVKDNYQLFKIMKNGKGRKIDFVGNCYANGYTTMRKSRALTIMQQSRLIDKLENKQLPLAHHLCASYVSRNSAYQNNDTTHMKNKYQKHMKYIKKVISERSREICGKK